MAHSKNTNDKRIDQLIPSTIPLVGTDLFAIYNANGTRNDSLTSLTQYVGQNIVVTGITANDTYVTGGTLNVNALELGRNQGLSDLTIDLSSFTACTRIYTSNIRACTGDGYLEFNTFGIPGYTRLGSELNYGLPSLELFNTVAGGSNALLQSSGNQFLSLHGTGTTSNARSIELRNGNLEGGIELSVQPLSNTPTPISSADVQLFDNTVNNKSTKDTDTYVTSINSRNTTMYSGVTNSVAVGGVGLSVINDDTAYVDNLNINTLGTGTTINNLGIDSNGKVVQSTTGNGYRVYTSLLTQTGVTIPTEIILENTTGLGNITWTRNSAGFYNGQLTGLFTNPNKVFVVIGSVMTPNSQTIDGAIVQYERLDANNFSIGISQPTLFSWTDNSLTNTALEIRVYN